jgi:predicted alpha/beta-fold hydrolase
MRRRLLKIVLVLVALSLVAYLGVSVAVAYNLTHPARSPLKTTPAQYGLEYEEVNFNSEGDKIPLSGWLVNPSGRPTVVILHGSGSNRANFINMEVSKALVAHGYSVFLFDFR